jgi:hypothetical protein
MKTKIILCILGLTTLFACKKSDSDLSTPAKPQLHFVIGQAYQGGVVAYIDPTGQHGFIAAPSDMYESTFPWWGKETDPQFRRTNAIGTAIGTGKSNTDIICTARDPDYYVAADVCNNFDIGGYFDWYMPSRDELYQLYVNRVAIGGFLETRYWSSTEFDETKGVYINFANGEWYQKQKDDFMPVRPIRAF